MMCFPLGEQSSAPDFRAQLSDSVPPEVKKISDESAFSVLAMVSLASLTAVLGPFEAPWMLEGFPYCSMK